eukprot:6835350-Pyramimonas_sp.AAC.1
MPDVESMALLRMSDVESTGLLSASRRGGSRERNRRITHHTSMMLLICVWHNKPSLSDDVDNDAVDLCVAQQAVMDADVEVVELQKEEKQLTEWTSGDDLAPKDEDGNLVDLDEAHDRLIQVRRAARQSGSRVAQSTPCAE